MKKRLFIVLLCVITMSGMMLFANGSKESEQGVVNFKFVSNNQDVLLTGILHEMADLMIEKSNGTLQPKLFLEGQLGSNDEDYCTGLSEGNFEMLCNPEWFQIWTSPEWLGLMNTPFIFRDAQHLQDFWRSDIGSAINQKSIDQFNTYTYAQTVALRGARYLTANKPITNVSDVKGLKMRTPNVPGVVASWKAAGANVTPIPWGELYSALQTGIVDAQENPAANIDIAAMYQVQDYLMMTGHQYTCFFIHLNNKWFKNLTMEQQKAITDSIDEAFTKYNNEVIESESLLLEKFKEKGMTIIEKKDIDIDSFKEKIVPAVLEEYKDVYAENGWDKIQAIL